MVRLTKFTEEMFLDAAIELAAQCGGSAVSIAAIARKTGAPVGSLYHRFASREELLAHAWLKVRSQYRQQIADLWGERDTWLAVAAFLQWCRSAPLQARFLLQCRECPALQENLSAELRLRLEAEQDDLDGCFDRCLQRLGTCLPGENLDSRLRFTLIDAPFAMVQPFLLQDQPIPASIDVMLRASHRALCPGSSLQ
ncbi:MAG: TetR/AcrR family transcriptional regulator [Pseudomonas sp.]|uniref:TetR/AcrR family transcriptional regulator n=1 Tax=Pseudomonas sp. TaxID=306 RepID=UPI00339AAEFA